MTPREKGRGSVTPVTLKDGRRVQVIRWTDIYGNDRRKRLQTTKATAERRLAEIIRERDLRMAGMGTLAGLERPWHEVFAEYLPTIQGRLSERHVERVEVEVPEILTAIGAHTLGDITAPDVRRWRDRYAKGRAAATANKRVSKVSAFLSWCVEEEIIERNVLRGMRQVKAKAVRPPRALTEAEIARLLEAFDQLDALAADQRAAVLSIAGGTKSKEWNAKERITPFPLGLTGRFLLKVGARFGAARQVRWSDVSLKARELRIRAENVKTDNGRTLPIDDELQALLEQCRTAAHRTTGRLPKSTDTVLLTPLGKEWGTNGSRNFLQWLYRALEAADIPRIDDSGERIHTHALRHTWASRLARAGVPMAKVQYLGGWKTLDVLTRIYTHLKAADALDDVAAVPLPEPASKSDSGNNSAHRPAPVSAAAIAAARKLLESQGYRVVGVTGLEPATHSTQTRAADSSDSDTDSDQRQAGGVK